MEKYPWIDKIDFIFNLVLLYLFKSLGDLDVIHIKSLKKSFVQNGSFWLFLSIFNAPTSSNFVVDSLYGAWWLATSQILGTSKKTNLDLEFGSFFFLFFWTYVKIAKKQPYFRHFEPNFFSESVYMDHTTRVHDSSLHLAKKWPLDDEKGHLGKKNSRNLTFWPRGPIWSTLS